MIEYPITVNDIKYDEKELYSDKGWRSRDIGKFVSIRSVHKEDGTDTFLGIYLGEFAVSLGVTYKPESKDLEITRSMYNPAIYVFKLRKVLFGIESWWGIIKSEGDLKKITDQDIDNVWYVKALKELTEIEKLNEKIINKS